jgi:hypothetical protein
MTGHGLTLRPAQTVPWCWRAAGVAGRVDSQRMRPPRRMWRAAVGEHADGTDPFRATTCISWAQTSHLLRAASATELPGATSRRLWAA